VKVETSSRARAQIERIDAWWRGQRDKAPELFKEELSRAEAFLAVTPNLAKVYQTRRDRPIRWVILPKTKVKLYFWVDEKKGIVNVVSAWGGKRERGPKL
jgi:hypothetical protein